MYPESLQPLFGYDFGGPFPDFVNGGDPKWLLDNGCENLPSNGGHTLRADINEAATRMTHLPLGNIKYVPIPEREGVRAKTMLGFEEAG